MHRRLIFAAVLVGLLVGLAGCADTAGSISLRPVDETSLADSASRTLPEEDQATEMRSAQVVRRAIETGTTETIALRPPVESGLPFRHDGRFYNLSYEVDGRQPGYLADVEIDYNASSVEGSVVAYEDLPAVDRQTLQQLLGGPRERLQEGYDFGVGVSYGEGEAESSVLLPEQEYDAVRYRGEVYPIEVSETESVTLKNYRYEATVVAESPVAYGQYVAERYTFELSGLPEAEGNVVDEALNSSYYADSTDDSGFGQLVERFRSREAVQRDEFGGKWVVRYEGQRYWVVLEYGPFVQDVDTVTSPSVTPPD